MTLRLEDEAPEDSGEDSGKNSGTPPRADREAPKAAFTLELLGFRNDLARHRALSFLSERDHSPTDLGSLPCTIFGELDRGTGTSLADELTDLGAIVRLSPVAGPESREEPPSTEDSAHKEIETFDPSIGVVESAPEGSRMMRFSVSWQAIRLIVIIGLGAFLIGRQLGAGPAPAPVPHPRFANRKPASAPIARKVNVAKKTSWLPVKQLIKKGDLAAAQEALSIVLEDNETAEAMALQGEIYAEGGDWGAASGAFERSIELGGDDPDVFLALAGIYRQQGKQSEAVDMLHLAQQNGAKGRDFRAIKNVVIAEQEAESEFGSIKSAHFTASFNEGRDYDAAQLVLSNLEDAYLTVGHKLGHYPSHRTPVALYAARDFQRVTHSPGWAGALYDGRIKVPVRGLHGTSSDLASTMRHEYAHAVVVSLTAGRCPVWLNEGVAMWAEEDRDGERQDWATATVTLDRNLSLRRLEKSFMNLSSTRAAAAYAYSYLAVRHIVARYGERPLQNLLEALASTSSTEEAFLEALPVDLASFEQELQRTIR